MIDEIKVVIADQDTEVTSSLIPQWQRVCRKPIDIEHVRGNHFYLNNPDRQLAEYLLRFTVNTRNAHDRAAEMSQ